MSDSPEPCATPYLQADRMRVRGGFILLATGDDVLYLRTTDIESFRYRSSSSSDMSWKLNIRMRSGESYRFRMETPEPARWLAEELTRRPA